MTINTDSGLDFSETYDVFTSSDDYASRFAGSVGEWLLKVQEQATLRMLAAYPNATILYVGGGHGQGMEALLQAGHKVTVLSSAEECSKRIQKYMNASLIEFRVGSILNMPYPDRAFDVVISYRLTAHMSRWQDYLRELARVARKAVILDYPEARSINYIGPRLFRFKKHFEPNTRRFVCFREAQLLQAFKEVGFQRSDRFPQYFLPMMLHRLLRRPALSAALESFFRTVGLTALFGSPVILKVERTG